MAENKNDRRALKTKTALKEALASLLVEKELRHISVRELSDKAKVHRVTFYKHYYDVNELYDQLENEVLTELGLLFMKFYENPSKSFGKELMDYIAQNPKIFKMIFTPNNTGLTLDNRKRAAYNKHIVNTRRRKEDCNGTIIQTHLGVVSGALGNADRLFQLYAAAAGPHTLSRIGEGGRSDVFDRPHPFYEHR